MARHPEPAQMRIAAPEPRELAQVQVAALGPQGWRG
jgi:hypothetical protein